MDIHKLLSGGGACNARMIKGVKGLAGFSLGNLFSFRQHIRWNNTAGCGGAYGTSRINPNDLRWLELTMLIRFERTCGILSITRRRLMCETS